MRRNDLNSNYDMAEGRRRPGLLLFAFIAVVLVYGGVLGWLFLSDGRLAGQPVAMLAVAPEDVSAPKMENLLRGNSDTNETDPADADPDQLTEDEQSLLDAAKRLSGDPGSDAGTASAGAIKIVGAESVNETDSDTSEPANGALRPVPDPALISKGKNGPLPVIAADGRQAWKVYARPLPKGLAAKPRIAIVVSGLGISASATQHAINILPPEITLSFAPYGDNLQKWISKARAAGHEVLLELPMEPFGYPQNDPGPYTLLTSLQPADNLARLDWLMSRFTGYAGVMNYQGARFTSMPEPLSPVLEALKSRGLFYVDNGASQRSLVPKLAKEAQLPFVLGDRQIDPVQSPEVVMQSLSALEGAAKQNGTVVGIATGLPVTVDEIARWAKNMSSKGVVLVPVTATAFAPSVR